MRPTTEAPAELEETPEAVTEKPSEAARNAKHRHQAEDDQPTKRQRGKHAKPKHGKSEKERRAREREDRRPSLVREGVDKLIPGAGKYLPDWATPIVYEVKKRSSPGTTVQAFMSDDGKLVIDAYVDYEKPQRHGWIGLFAVAQEQSEQPRSVHVTVKVEDPSSASFFTPATVEVTSTDPETGETATSTREVFRPQRAESVTSQTITESVEEVSEPKQLAS